VLGSVDWAGAPNFPPHELVAIDDKNNEFSEEHAKGFQCP